MIHYWAGAIGATYFLSGKYDALVRASKFEELATHVLEDVDPDFVKKVRPGDLIVAGTAFGTGKHLEGLIGAFKALGLGGVMARGFAAAWERDSINLGFPAVLCPDPESAVRTGDELEIELHQQEARNLTRACVFAITPTPAGIIELLEAGGIEPYTLRRLRAMQAAKQSSDMQAN